MVHWAPLVLPLRRRLETLAVLLWASALALALAVTAVFAVVPLLWPITIAYVLFLVMDDAPEHGGRVIPLARRLPVRGPRVPPVRPAPTLCPPHGCLSATATCRPHTPDRRHQAPPPPHYRFRGWWWWWCVWVWVRARGVWVWVHGYVGLSVEGRLARADLDLLCVVLSGEPGEGGGPRPCRHLPAGLPPPRYGCHGARP
jgi:hypothetical protein